MNRINEKSRDGFGVNTDVAPSVACHIPSVDYENKFSGLRAIFQRLMG
jgi:hypothetical protein